MVELQCRCGAAVLRKIWAPIASCDECKRTTQNLGLRKRRAARSGIKQRHEPQDRAASNAARIWYQSNKEAIKLARAMNIPIPEARRELAGRA